MTSVVTRFAPSPTGFLHLGHAFSALFAEREARRAGGRFLLRIEDIDRGRCRPAFEDAIYEDLAWLGLAWESPVRRQSDHFGDYAAALAKLDAMGLIYPCFCTRKEIRAEIARAGGAPHDAEHGPEGPVYPGTCRELGVAEREARKAAGNAFALRLDMTAAAAIARQEAGPLRWHDRDRGEIAARPDAFGDVVLARTDTPTSYHLAVTLDDDLQGVTLVTRGTDLFAVTDIHRVLQTLLGLAVPDYRHHRLLTGADGKRFAKRDGAVTLRSLREGGVSPARVREIVDAAG
jgi:glutamyl-Q tRNA(Asp) synthetase